MIEVKKFHLDDPFAQGLSNVLRAWLSANSDLLSPFYASAIYNLCQKGKALDAANASEYALLEQAVRQIAVERSLTQDALEDDVYTYFLWPPPEERIVAGVTANFSGVCQLVESPRPHLIKYYSELLQCWSHTTADAPWLNYVLAADAVDMPKATGPGDLMINNDRDGGHKMMLDRFLEHQAYWLAQRKGAVVSDDEASRAVVSVGRLRLLDGEEEVLVEIDGVSGTGITVAAAQVAIPSFKLNARANVGLSNALQLIQSAVEDYLLHSDLNDERSVRVVAYLSLDSLTRIRIGGRNDLGEPVDYYCNGPYSDEHIVDIKNTFQALQRFGLPAPSVLFASSSYEFGGLEGEELTKMLEFARELKQAGLANPQIYGVCSRWFFKGDELVKVMDDE